MTFIEDVADAIKVHEPDAQVGILTPTPYADPVIVVNVVGTVFVVSVQECVPA